MMPYREKLSEVAATGGPVTSLATYPTLTTIHTVPPDEVHTIWLNITNTNAAVVELLGDVGGVADSWNHKIAAETNQDFGPITLHGGSSGTNLELSAIANGGSIKVSGSVERYRSLR